MIHRAPFGSLERFIAVIIEHTGGRFPLWLSPEQAIILPVSDKYLDVCEKLKQELSDLDIRATVDDRNEKVGRKIRDAELTKIPFMLVVGEKEAADGTISVREHGQGDLGSLTVEAFTKLIKERITVQLGS
jgi:threonyl-tRNA synthetase